MAKKRKTLERAPACKGWAAIYDGEIDMATIRETWGEVKEAQRYIIRHERFTRVLVIEIPKKRK